MINEAFKKLTSPKILRPHIKNFNDWLDNDFEGTLIDDLKGALKYFERDEMYEDCILIKNKLDNLVKMQGTNKNGISNSDTH